MLFLSSASEKLSLLAFSLPNGLQRNEYYIYEQFGFICQELCFDILQKETISHEL